MKVPPHIIRLYVRTARRYKKLFAKAHRGNVSPYQRTTFLHKLKKLLKRLRELEAQLKLAAATGTIALMLNSSPVKAQVSAEPSALGPFLRQNRIVNPLREPLFNGSKPALAVGDLDNDGDLDVVMGEEDDYYGGFLRYFENQSSQGHAVYLERVDDENPFDGLRALTESVAPALIDIDNDGDLDLFMAEDGQPLSYLPGADPSEIFYYRNHDDKFSPQSGPWNPITKSGNPLDGVGLGYYLRPVVVDFDDDGDSDIVCYSYLYQGTYPEGTYEYLHLFKNDGSGSLSHSDLQIDNYPPSWSRTSPAMADLDADGDLDLVLGSYDNDRLLYYRQDSDGTFAIQFDAWDPTLKTGNPFNDFTIGSNSAPAFIDFNNDGLIDLFVADEAGFNKYSDRIVNYYKNEGNSSFKQIETLENPFQGIAVEEYASTVLMDVDGDADLEVVVGNNYSSSYYDYDGTLIYTYSEIDYYKLKDGAYEQDAETSPFSALQTQGYFAPSFGDVDGDGDADMISGTANGGIGYFVNVDGVYQPYPGRIHPFSAINVIQDAYVNLVDIDNDGDLDLFVTNGYGEFHYFKNIGTPQAPNFSELTGADNPLAIANTYGGSPPFLTFSDLDHDGDLDVVFNGRALRQQIPEVLYIENTGTKNAPVFNKIFGNFLPEADPAAPQPEFVDADHDGDLDAFVGNEDGTISYLENKNEPVKVTVTGSAVEYDNASEPVVIDPGLILADEDNDFIVQATVTIQSHQPGEALEFTPHTNINGVFDPETGVLTFRGKTTLAEYQALLRTVTFEATYETGRTRPSKNSTIAKTISFSVFDQDFTTPIPASKTVEVFVNDPPAVNNETITITLGGSTSVDLKEIIADPDGAGDLDFTTLQIIEGPSSGATVTIDANGLLNVDYRTVNFVGTETMTIEVCDRQGACAQNIITLVVIDNGVEVYNAVAPNSSGDNRFMRISGLPEKHKVTIFSRWGDKVFDTENYDTSGIGNAFRGKNNKGTALPSGTYFYTIEIPGAKLISGYLTLKQ